VDSNGGITRSPGPDGLGEEISLVSLVYLGNNLVVTAVRDGSGKLKLISWKVDSNGGITRSPGPDGLGEEISLVSILPFFHSRTFTVERDKNGNLKFRFWESDNIGAFQSSSEADLQDEKVTLIATEDLFSDDALVTAVQDSSGKLRLIYYFTREMGVMRA
jgi:hypothetical protein